MLPVTGFNDILFPMTADIYYPYEDQNSIGEIVNDWSYDKTITCSAIKDRPSTGIKSAVSSAKFIEYDFALDFRTPDDISISSTNEYQPFTDILITNILDPSGKSAWSEPSGYPTVFEIENIEPLFDPFHNVFAYRIRARRSDNQVNLNG